MQYKTSQDRREITKIIKVQNVCQTYYFSLYFCHYQRLVVFKFSADRNLILELLRTAKFRPSPFYLMLNVF